MGIGLVASVFSQLFMMYWSDVRVSIGEGLEANVSASSEHVLAMLIVF